MDSTECTVILCCKNAEESIRMCIESIQANNPGNLIVIDGKSTDKTREIISSMGVEFIEGLGKGLTADRQMGIELSVTKWSFFIDSDHSIPKNFLSTMVKLMEEGEYTLLQSTLGIMEPVGLLNKGEDIYYEVVHNAPQEKIIPGLAPTVFFTDLLKAGTPLAIDDGLTATIDDTNWATKAKSLGVKIGILGPKVLQRHPSSFINYYKKFKWYGIGDGEFCHAQPNHRRRHYFHLLIRYPLIYSTRALLKRKPNATPFLVMQGLVRAFWCARTDMQLKFVSKTVSQ